MKLLILVTGLILLMGCATQKDKSVIENSKEHSVKTYQEKKELLKKMILAHNEFNQETKMKLEKVLLDAFDRAKSLKDRESQLMQEVLKQSIVENSSYEKLVILKKELKNLYNTKYKNFETAINDLKKIIGIKAENEGLYEDLYEGDFLIQRDRR